jgi:hypothetical protein
MSEILCGDALATLRTLPENFFASLVCDPPAGIRFMGKDWDHHKGGRDQWIAWLAEIMAEALRVVKPGGHAFVWALPRTSHWTARALEDAGWEIREKMYHHFGNGFPKNWDISKAIDERLGKSAEREMVGYGDVRRASHSQPFRPRATQDAWRDTRAITAPATQEASLYNGYGTATKPATEEWILCRKPLSEPTIAANVLRWQGCGALNIDVCRIGTERRTSRGMSSLGLMHDDAWQPQPIEHEVQGRWPSNLLLSHSVFCTEDTCTEDCPIRRMDEQSGTSKSRLSFRGNGIGNGYHGSDTSWNTERGRADSGGASRFFQQFRPAEELDEAFLYCSKASKRDRSTDGAVENTHPTCKSTALMRYLVALVTPPGGTVLDCFAGSGTTGVACAELGFSFVGIEQQEEYCEIARARIDAATVW